MGEGLELDLTFTVCFRSEIFSASGQPLFCSSPGKNSSISTRRPTLP